MANTTSGTTTFDKTFSIDEIIEEAFERLGIQNVSGYQLKTSRRSLNIMLQEWGNRGIHYWEIAETNIDLIEGQSEYKFFRSSKAMSSLDGLKISNRSEHFVLIEVPTCPVAPNNNIFFFRIIHPILVNDPKKALSYLFQR